MLRRLFHVGLLSPFLFAIVQEKIPISKMKHTWRTIFSLVTMFLLRFDAGNFGQVFKGTLMDKGGARQPVAIKSLHGNLLLYYVNNIMVIRLGL